jgi:hypothetical protein
LWMAQCPARRPRRRSRALSRAQVGSGQWLEGRSGPAVRPFASGIELPHRRDQPRRRARADAGSSGHRARHGPRRPGDDRPRQPARHAGVNLAFGQAYLARLRDNSATGACCPR